MSPSFFALFSKAGIACAADTDHTIHQLSRDLPLALAVNPASQIPWSEIIESYKASIDPKLRAHFCDYVSDFDSFLSTVPADGKWRKLTVSDSDIILLGFGSEDIFPSVCDVNVIVRENGVLGLEEISVRQVSQENPTLFHFLGDFESVSTLLYGTTAKTRRFFYDRYIEIWKEYSRIVSEKCKGTRYEKYVNESLEAYDYENEIAELINDATDASLKELSQGVNSFSIEGMITAVETIVNANAKLNHLRACAHGKPGETKEIAVITIPEGLTWIKHSLYMRRNEI